MEATLEEQLLQLYASLEAESPKVNRCGSCRTCCTAAGLSKQLVTDLELEVLGSDKTVFARYAARERDATGDYVFPTCPYLGPQGCQVYARRPFSCRVFGYYRLRGGILPQECVYQGLDQEFASPNYYRIVPGAWQLRQLSRDFQLRKAPHINVAQPFLNEVAQPFLTEVAQPFKTRGINPDTIGLNPDDIWDMALAAISRGELPALPPEQADEKIFSTYVRALVAGEQARHSLALKYYLKVIKECPQRHDLMTMAGFHAFQTGGFAQAEQLWLTALKLFPGNPLTFSFLGYLYHHQQQWQMAADFFGAAAELEPQQLLHACRRDQALKHLSS